MQAQLRTDDNHGTTRVVHALTQQVLAETALLALQQVRQGLQWAVARAGDGAAATAVVEQRVHGFLQHALLVVHDDLGRAEVDHALEAVVAVDHATVQVVQVGGGKTATIELNHGAQLRRDHRNAVQNHACRIIAGALESRNDLQALEGTHLLLAFAFVDDGAQLLGLGVKVEVADQGLDGLGTHAAGEVVFVAVHQLGVDGLIDNHLLRGKLDKGIPDFIQAIDFALGALADVLHLLVSCVLHLAAGVGLRTSCFQLGEVFFQLLGTLGKLRFGVSLHVLLLQQHFSFQSGQVVVAGFLIDAGDDVRSEVDDAFQVLRRQVQQVAQAGGHTLEVPDVGHGCSEFNVAHALTAHLGLGDFHTTALTNDALVTDALVFATSTFPVAGGAENTLAEEAVLFGLQGSVVDGLRLFNLALGPATNVVGGGESDAELVEEVDV